MKRTIALSIIIPVALDALRLAWVLEGLCHQSRDDFEVIAAIDTKPGAEAHQDVLQVLADYENRLDLHAVQLRRKSRKYRVAAARNLGAQHSRGDVLMFLDADCVPQPATVASYLEQLHQCGPNTVLQGTRRLLDQALVTPLEHASIERTWPDRVLALREQSLAKLDRLTDDLENIWGFCLMLHADLFCKIGGFRADYEGWGGEDSAFGRDLQRVGAQITAIFEAPDAPALDPDLVHLGHDSQPRNSANFSAARVRKENAEPLQAPVERLDNPSDWLDLTPEPEPEPEVSKTDTAE